MDAFNPQIEPTRPPWKIIGVIAGAIVLATLLIAGALLFARSRAGFNVAVQNLARVESKLNQELLGCAQDVDPDACRERKVRLAASSTGAASICENLEGEDRDDCVWGVASDQSDPKACASMEDATAAVTCADTVYAKLAIAAGNDALCQQISDGTRRDNCEATFLGPASAGNCAERGHDAAYCADLVLADAAIAASDLAACRAIVTQDQRGRCIDAIGIPDADGDGLDVEQEFLIGTSDMATDTDGDGLSDGDEANRYHSSPTRTDTDGDGFGDGEEVQNGYNPNGAGALAE